MAALILLRPGLDWSASGGLFDWTLEYLIPRLSDREVADRLQEIVDNNLGSAWLSEFSAPAQREIAELLRHGLVAEAERELPETEYKAPALDQLRELVELAYQL